MTAAPLLHIEGLRTYFYSRSKQAFIRSVDNVSLAINQGETLGVVGESGSGKSVTALSIMGLVTSLPGVISGRIDFAGSSVQQNLLEGLDQYVTLTEDHGRIMGISKEAAGWRMNSEKLLGPIRGKAIGMIFQNPKSALNPFTTVGRQITEAIRLHTKYTGASEAKERAIYWLERVKIDSPKLRFDNYPFGLSGGMCQRAMIAMALSSEPRLLIADEPTTGLDATIQSKIVDLMAELKQEIGITTMLISHDISVIKRLSDRVAVMYGGTVVENGAVDEILSPGASGRHPYTEALLASIPNETHVREKVALQAIEGEVLDTINIPEGCRFFARCNRVTDAVRERCQRSEPDLREVGSGHAVRCWLFCDR